MAHPRKQTVQQGGCGRFAVGAGHAHHLHLTRRMIVKISCNLTQVCGRIRRENPGY